MLLDRTLGRLGQSMEPERIVILDTTLRDGEQSPGATMNVSEKVRLARQLERLGVDIIEAGFPAASSGDFEAVRGIAQTIKDCTVMALCRPYEEDIRIGWEAIREAHHPAIHIFLSTSEIHLKHQLRMNQYEVVGLAVKAVREARARVDEVEFSAMDATRTDSEFLCRIFEAVIDAGATVVDVADTVGYALPHLFGDLIQRIRDRVPNIHQARLSVHCHNDLGLAVANSLEGIQAGARQVEVTVNGIGERAGNASLEEIVMILHTRKDELPFYTGIRTEYLYETSRLVTHITGIVVQPNKALVGANAFVHESGIHQDGILKEKSTYQIITPEEIGLNPRVLMLGKHSGRHALRRKLQEMGYDLTPEELDRVFVRFKTLADRKKEVYDEDIEALVADEILRIPDRYKLLYLNVVSGSVAVPTATVKMEVDGEVRQDAGFGNGPVDATYATIGKITKTKSRLSRFTVSAITGGTDAQGEVTVRLEEDGHVVVGQGAHPDIIMASAKAYVNALNRLDYLKRNPRKIPHHEVGI